MIKIAAIPAQLPATIANSMLRDDVVDVVEAGSTVALTLVVVVVVVVEKEEEEPVDVVVVVVVVVSQVDNDVRVVPSLHLMHAPVSSHSEQL